MSTETFTAYAITCLLISLAPGAGVISSISTRLNKGFTCSLWNLAGLECALSLQIIAVICGLGAVLASSEVAISVVKWGGAAYLLYLAFSQFRSASTTGLEKQINHSSSGFDIFAKGLLTNLSNPKAMIFILALLPQFIDLRESIVSQYTIMGITMIGIDAAVMIFYTFIASKATNLISNEIAMKRINQAFGTCFAAMATMICLVKI
ncbi:LysE family transporter [Pseudomonas sp. DCB_AW]|uniref:LysE family transporter n=1 Tax=Pseudomonas sp. DCB_AW TaxID=2993596 RepID=UPI0022491890|nr:LysE family transporter [Pseudomonas sp. DCB_AW]MCX2684644.1 LysE family transporter [Pseudomonas sp. DCB_AW]